MAERRMFNKTIIDSDMFLDMPLSTQALYFHLSMRADDEGFINNPKRILRMIGANDDDLMLLITKQFVIPFDSGIVVIKHWKIHNYIRSDRFKATKYLDEKAQIEVKSTGEYVAINSTDTDCIQNVVKTDTACQPLVVKTDTTCQPFAVKMDTQDRLGKDSIGKYIENTCSSSAVADTPTPFNYQSVIDVFNSVCVSLPKVKTLTDSRKKAIKAADKKLNGDFKAFFEKVEQSDFLTGRSGKWSGCSFDWILKQSNLIKIIEGNYTNKSNGNTSKGHLPTLSDYAEEF